MKRRKFLSLAPSSVFVPFVAQYCTDDEFEKFSIVDSGELTTGAKWAVTNLKTTPDSKNPPKETPETLPAVLSLESEYSEKKTTYLDEGNVYQLKVDVAVPVIEALDGVDIKFGNCGGFPWKLFFELDYEDTVDDWKFIHPPKQKYIVYTVKFTFEFEGRLKRYFVWLDDTTDEKSEKIQMEKEHTKEKNEIGG